jgi:hypothetical protein
MECSMKIVTVDSADLKTVLSLLRVYRGVDRPGGHVKSLDAGPLDPFHLVRINNLERALKEAGE